MTLTINIPDAVANDVVNGICAVTNYDAGSGKTKAQWAKVQLIKTMKNMAVSGQARSTVTNTRATLDAAAIN
jgi:hypothetical protein